MIKAKTMVEKDAVADGMDLDFDSEWLEGDIALCLCGRDPASEEFRSNLAKAMTLSAQHRLAPVRCLRQLTGAFDHLFVSLKPTNTSWRKLRRPGNDWSGYATIR